MHVFKCKKLRYICFLVYPLFCVLFFLLYLFLLCPYIWKQHYNYDVSAFGYNSWTHFWLYAFWIVAVATWILLIVTCAMFGNGEEEKDVIIEHLTRGQSPETYIPFTSYLQSIQPAAVHNRESNFSALEVDVVDTVVQPPVKSLPGPRADGDVEDWENLNPQTPAESPKTLKKISETEWDDLVPWPKPNRQANVQSESEASEDVERIMEDFTNYLHLVPEDTASPTEVEVFQPVIHGKDQNEVSTTQSVK